VTWRSLFIYSTACCLITISSFHSITQAEETRRIHSADASKQGVGQNIDAVERLVNESVAARQILDSQNEQALALHKKALEYLKQARQAQSHDDAHAVAQALNNAKIAIFQGIRLVGNKVVRKDKRQRYNKMLHSLKALLEAHHRIAVEKGNNASTIETENHARTEMAEAQKLYSKGQLDQAMIMIDDAYSSVKFSLTKLRNGATLVRSLHFNTAQDEYRYEVTRNDTHNILINTVLKDKLSDPRLGKLMAIPMEQARKLRQQAELQAKNGQFKSAIKTMEQATRQLIRAIRMAGIYIPG
jgi:tetratricopeptide (TPR) repeat protein